MDLRAVVAAIKHSAEEAGVVIDAEIAEPRVMIPLETTAGGLEVEVYRWGDRYVAQVHESDRRIVGEGFGRTLEAAVSAINWAEIPGVY